VAEVPYGAHPSSCYPRYAYDRGHLREYVSAAQAGPGDLEKYLATYVQGDEESYREAVGSDRLAALAGWSQSIAAWQEIFR
jgi:glutaconate CoA-transferase subunit A